MIADLDKYICHRDVPGSHAAKDFAHTYFAAAPRVLLIAGIGFDPRTAHVARLLKEVAGNKLSAVFVRESRPNPPKSMSDRADMNVEALSKAMGEPITPTSVEILAADGAVVGGRRIVELVGTLDIESFTDVIVDLSALSRGIFFPLVRVLREMLAPFSKTKSLHLMLFDQPALDYSFRPESNDRATYIHGFDGGANLRSGSPRVKLWLPQLIRDRAAMFNRIHDLVKPDGVCPVIAFPRANPRLGDQILFEYRDMLFDSWEVDPKNFVLAHESDPLDFYRTVERISTYRRRLFSPNHRALTILSPTGSKIGAVGTLLAAIDSDYPVAYVETVAYRETDMAPLATEPVGTLAHVWMSGPVYTTAHVESK